MEAGLFGWREAILLLLGLAVMYLLVTLFRLLRAGKSVAKPRKAEPPLAETAFKEAAAAAEAHEPPMPELTEMVSSLQVNQSNEWNDVVDLDLTDDAPGDAANTVPATSPSPPVSGFGEQLAEHLARSDLEREVRQLRKEVNELRAEIDELRAVRNISPQYAEAVALAQRGLSAQDVADRMGISLAEAELVHALSRGESLFDEGEHDDKDRDDGETGTAGSERYESRIGYGPRYGG